MKKLLLATAAIVALSMAAPPADAHGGGAGWGIGLGVLGGLALGSALANPYVYNPYPYGYYPPPTYYYPPIAPYSIVPPSYYPPVRSCWNSYYQTYYTC
jgi:hypothetical protein